MLMQLSKNAHEGEKNKGKAVDALSLVQTVHENYEGYTRGEILKATEARRAQTMLGSPNERPGEQQHDWKLSFHFDQHLQRNYVAVPRSLVDANKVRHLQRTCSSSTGRCSS